MQTGNMACLFVQPQSEPQNMGNSGTPTHDTCWKLLNDFSVLTSCCILFLCRAAAHSEVGKFGEAIADCEKAIQIDPLYSKAYSRLGWVYHAQGRFQEAIDKGFQKGLHQSLFSFSF